MFTYLRIIIVINFSDIVDKGQANKTTVLLNDLGDGEWKNIEDKCKMGKKGSPKEKNKNKMLWKYILKIKK